MPFNTVGSDARFAPDGAGPETERPEITIVAGSTPALQRDALGVGQKQAAAGFADTVKNAVEFIRAFGNQARRTFACAAEFDVGEKDWLAVFLRRKTVRDHAAAP